MPQLPEMGSIGADSWGRGRLITGNKLIDQGRIPISHKNIRKIPWNKRLKSYENLVCENSEHADLVIMGFSLDKITQEKGQFFNSFDKIKENENWKNIPVVFLTARTDRVAKNAGGFLAEDYIEKPFEIDDLLQRIKIAINK